MTDTYDVIVIGAGPAGENVAWRATDHGLTAVIVERELVGGECSYWACMPSKALLRPGEALAAVRRVPGAREAVTGEIDLAAALQRRDALSSGWDDAAQVRWLDSVNTDLVRGHGRISGERTVDVTQADGSVRRLTANKAVVIATGTGAAIPPVDGLREIPTWNNRDITTITAAPASLIVLGGGVVGVEMAQAWRRLGAAEVTIVEMADRLLSGEEPFVGDDLRAAFEAEGMRVLTGAQAVKAERASATAPVTLHLKTGETLTADEILVATGRRPLTDDIGLENVGLTPRGYIDVDDQLRATGVAGEWLYAVGDVNGRALLTHMGKYQARIAGDVIAGRAGAAWADHRAVPRVVFTDPQIAAVGLTQAQAHDADLNVRAVTFGTTHVAAASALGEGLTGTSQLLIDEDRRVIVGATFTGPAVGEMLHAATIAIVGEVPMEQLWHAVPSFPTISEVWLRLMEAYGL